MTSFAFFIRSFLVGFVICMPIGPIALMLIKKTLYKNRRAGLISGFGSACADALFTIVVAFGLTFISNTILQYQVALQVAAAAFIASLGMRTLRAAAQQHVEEITTTYKADFIETFVMALANPVTLIAIGGILATAGVVVDGCHPVQALAIVAGIFSGEMFWWLCAVLLFDYVGKHSTARVLVRINKIAGYTLLLVSTGILIRLIHAVRSQQLPKTIEISQAQDQQIMQ